MKVWAVPLRTISAEDDAVRIRGLFINETIPYGRISSVSVNPLLRRVKLETGAQVHQFQLWTWWPRTANRLADAIRQRLP